MAKTKDIKRRVGNTPTVYEIPESALPFGRGDDQKEPGSLPGVGGRDANTVRSNPTGKGPRKGNTPHHDTGNNDSADQKQRHTVGGRVAKTSENLPVREGGKKSNGK